MSSSLIPTRESFQLEIEGVLEDTYKNVQNSWLCSICSFGKYRTSVFRIPVEPIL